MMTKKSKLSNNFQSIISMVLLLASLMLGPNAHADIKLEAGYLQINGAQIYYQSFGQGNPIIVLHGGPGLDSGYLLPQMMPLGDSHKAIFYDQRGSGKSLDAPINEQTVNIKQFVADLNVLRKKLGYNKVTLVGHSWGGLLAMNYALQYPTHVSALILVNTAPASQPGFLKFVQEYDQRTANIVPRLKKLEESQDFMSGDPTTIAQYYRVIFSKYVVNPKDANKISLNFTNDSALDGMKVAAIMQKTYLSTKFSILDDLKKLRVPTLIIHGEEDVVPISTAEEIHQAIPQSQFVALADCGHFAYIEKPDEFFAHVNEFLQQQQPGAKK